MGGLSHLLQQEIVIVQPSAHRLVKLHLMEMMCTEKKKYLPPY